MTGEDARHPIIAFRRAWTPAATQTRIWAGVDARGYMECDYPGPAG
jgi:hypothetical protein